MFNIDLSKLSALKKLFEKTTPELFVLLVFTLMFNNAVNIDSNIANTIFAIVIATAFAAYRRKLENMRTKIEELEKDKIMINNKGGIIGLPQSVKDDMENMRKTIAELQKGQDAEISPE